MKDSNWLIRQRAIKVLGFLKAPAVLKPAYAAMISDPVEEVRRSAAGL